MFNFLSSTFSSIFSRLTKKGVLTESDVKDALEQVKQALLEADVPHQLVITFCQEIQQEVAGQKVVTALKPTEQLIKVVHEKLKSFLGGSTLPFQFLLPSTVMVMGLQGSGKTTTIAKLARLVRTEAEQKGKTRRIVLASVDYYRPAAREQLAVLARQIGVSYYESPAQDPLVAAQDCARYAQQQGYELLFLDTAGRLQVDDAMMQELKTIDARLKPKHKILVLDAMTGQQSLAVAQSFQDQVGFEAAVLTKMDSDTRAGAAFAFRYALKKPIVFVGTGEKIGDLERFQPDRLASRILGMGDVLSLIEKAQATIKQSEQDRLYKAVSSGQMNLQDFADQLAMMKKLGSFSTLMNYMPGMGTQMKPDQVERAEAELKKFRAIISSMTKKERILPNILDGSRKKRVAVGAGVEVTDVNLLLDRFEQSKQYAKMLKKFGRFPGLFK